MKEKFDEVIFMKKIKQYKNYVIAYDKDSNNYCLFTKEEWSYGEGMRYPEWDSCGSVAECEEFIDNI